MNKNIKIILIVLVAGILIVFSLGAMKKNKSDQNDQNAQKEQNIETYGNNITEDNTIEEKLSEQEIEAFNAIFEAYEGVQRRGSIMGLISSVESNNVDYADEREIAIEFSDEIYKT